jgi:hypothetical protein
MKKNHIYIVILLILVSCKNENYNKNIQSISVSFEEGLVMKYSWKKSSTESIILTIAAVKDTTYSTTGLKLFGSYTINKNTPQDLTGIYYPDSGYFFNLMDKDYYEIGLVKMHKKDNQEYEVNYQEPKKDAKTYKAYNITSNKQYIYIRNKFEQDCRLAESNKKNGNLDLPWDTSCSTLTLFWPEYKTENKKANSTLQNLIYKIDTLYNYLEGENYISVYESNLPIELAEDYICINQNGYIFTGGAHGMPISTYKNIDLTHKKLIYLYDMIDTLQKAKLNSISKAFFEAENGEIGKWNFSNSEFYVPDNVGILKDGLLFQYGAYEIGAYAQGLPKFFVPYNQLGNLIKKDNPLKIKSI